MLSRLRVRDLGVIESLDVEFAGGLTAITGETGAGKTLVVEALELLCGARADSNFVRSQADEAVIQALFAQGDNEHLVTRNVPRSGRSRAEIDGSLATIAMLESFGRLFVDLHGQHAHQSLLRKSVQREALDHFADIDLGAVEALRARRREIDAAIERIGGDDATRTRELDLLRFELGEIEQAAIHDEGELELLAAEEELLANVVALRERAALATEHLEGGSAAGAIDLLGEAISALSGASTFDENELRLRAVHAELSDVASEVLRATEELEEDPERLAYVRARRELLRHLIRKHGASLSDVLEFANSASSRVVELSESDPRRHELLEERKACIHALIEAEQIVGNKRRAAAPKLAAQIQSHLRELALGSAKLSVQVGSDDEIGNDVEFLFSANVGEPPLPLGKIASGGELARAMLALRLVLTAGPPTLVFDEVDAGIGGEAALTVGGALSALGRDHQVLVVTHLAQVAAHADAHIVVQKSEQNGRTVATVRRVTGDDRVGELARMLSGQPTSTSAREHAADLLASVAAR